ncbi:MAG: NUDIX hydrolase [Oscillospiraceae bacterium]
MRNRSVVFVIRNKKILMEKLCYEGRMFYSIPGGGIEEGETPEQAAIRELKEECGLDGTIVKKLAEVYSNGRTEYAFEVSVPDDQDAIKGYDPEEPLDDQPIKEVVWMGLSEMPEKDRAFMWRYGLLEIEGFFDEVLSWGDEISYPHVDECAKRDMKII